MPPNLARLSYATCTLLHFSFRCCNQLPSIYRSHDFLSVRRLHCDVPVTRIILSNSNMHLSLVSVIQMTIAKGSPFHLAFVFACYENWVQLRKRGRCCHAAAAACTLPPSISYLIASPSTWDPHKRCNKRNAAVLYRHFTSVE